MKRFVAALFLLALALPLCAEVRLGVEAEFYNTLATGSGLDDWRYFLSGTAGLSLRNKGSRVVRGELTLEVNETGGSAAEALLPT